MSTRWGVEGAAVIGNGVDDRFAPGDAEAERRWAGATFGLEVRSSCTWARWSRARGSTC